MSWAHKQDPEWQAFAGDNASGGGMLMFGRVTCEMMAGQGSDRRRGRWGPPMGLAMNDVEAWF